MNLPSFKAIMVARYYVFDACSTRLRLFYLFEHLGLLEFAIAVQTHQLLMFSLQSMLKGASKLFIH